MSDSNTKTPSIRITAANDQDVNTEGDYVLYWMTAFRRPVYNFALQRAFEIAHELDKPLLVFEALRCDYRWASDRIHTFVIQGMAENAEFFSRRKAAFYYPYLEPEKGASRGLLAALGKRACAVVGDDFPCFFLPRMMKAAARRLPVRFELVDSNGLLPMRVAEKVFSRAHDFRRFLQKNLLPHLFETPTPDPLQYQRLPKLMALPKEIENRWPAVDASQLATDSIDVADFPIDHDVAPSFFWGGHTTASNRLEGFLDEKIEQYDVDRNEPDIDGASGLSPYLHFGHLSTHEVFERVMQHAGWSPNDVAEKPSGSAKGWWGAPESVESFLDEFITWREVGYNFCWQRDDYDQYESLPDWAQTTLQEHAQDPRETVYSLAEFEAAKTHDELWNAAQRQLVQEGRIHNYLRMLWGKKILHWTKSPQDALAIMIELNNKYALDGRNPNSYSGIFWVLGRYDRAWGPERPIFGKIRYMTSENTARKHGVKKYLAKFGSNSEA